MSASTQILAPTLEIRHTPHGNLEANLGGAANPLLAVVSARPQSINNQQSGFTMAKNNWKEVQIPIRPDAWASTGICPEGWEAYLQITRHRNSAILMHFLEEEFKRSHSGFYRFFQPCVNPDYQAGQSWEEILETSPNRFRPIFDRIGTRYKTKQAYQDARKRGREFVTPGGLELFYCYYQDTGTGRTHFLRNHAAVERMLGQIEHQSIIKIGA